MKAALSSGESDYEHSQGLSCRLTTRNSNENRNKNERLEIPEKIVQSSAAGDLLPLIHSSTKQKKPRVNESDGYSH